jgi:hypothetical protein
MTQSETDSEELRQASLEMASYWMGAAMRAEYLGDSRVETAAFRRLPVGNLCDPSLIAQ